MYLVTKLAYHKTLTTKHAHINTHSTHPMYLFYLPARSPPCTLHTNHPVHHPPTHLHHPYTPVPTHSTLPDHLYTHTLHPDHTNPHTYFLVGLFHNVSCLSLVLLFESLRESIPLRQVTLALLLCPAETMSAYE